MTRLVVLAAFLSQGCIWVAAAPMIASQQKDNSTSVEPCNPSAQPSPSTDQRGEVYRCNGYDIIVRAPCNEPGGPAEIVWGPYHSPVSLSFKTTRKSCPIQTYRKLPDAPAVAAGK